MSGNEVEVVVSVRPDTKPGFAQARREALGEAEKLGRSIGDRISVAAGRSLKLSILGGVGGALGGVAGAAIGAALPAVLGLAAGFGVASAAMSGTSDALDAHEKALEGDAKAMAEYERLLAKMSPAQRDFTKQLVAMKPALGQLQDTAAESFLPGVTKFLKDSEKLLPVVDRGVERIGKTLSKTMSEFGDTVATDRFKANLEGAFETADVVTEGMADSFARLTDRSIQFADEMKPAAEGFASFLDGVTSGVEGMLDELAPHAEDFKSIWESLGSLSEDLLPMVGELVGYLSAELAPALRDAAAWVRENKDEIAAWVPVIGDVVLALAGLKVLTTVAGWARGAAAAFRVFGRDADDAGRKAGGLRGNLKGLGGTIGITLALIGYEEVKSRVSAMAEEIRAQGSNAGRDWGGAFILAADAALEWGPIWEKLDFTEEGRRAGVTAGTGILGGAAGVLLAEKLGFDVDPTPAENTIKGVVAFGNASKSRGAHNANTGPAQGQLKGFVSWANRQNSRSTHTVVVKQLQQIRKFAHGGVGGGLTLVGEQGPELIRGMASGGPTGRGMRLVGEQGPELVDMPAGSTVIPAGGTQRMLRDAAQGGDGGPRALEVRFGGNTDGAFATAFMRLVREGKIQIQTA